MNHPFRLAARPDVRLQHLSDIHSRRYAQRIQHDLEGCAVFCKRHILLRKDTGDNALISVTSRHLVAHIDLSLRSDIASY